MSLQVGTKIRNAMKSTLNCCKLQVIFKSERTLSNIFRFTIYCQVCFINTRVVDAIPSFMVRQKHLKVRSAGRIGISLLTLNKIKPSKESLMHDDLLKHDNNPSFDEFIILAHRNEKYLLEIKESLLLKHVQPILHKNFSAALHLFNTV